VIGLDDRDVGETVVIFIIAFRGEDGINKRSSCFMSLFVCFVYLFIVCLLWGTSCFIRFT